MPILQFVKRTRQLFFHTLCGLRAARAPFVTASVIPFIAGSGLGGEIRIGVMLLGLVAVCLVHLSANFINDYADSRSGADWLDTDYHGGLFGGSKLIQEQVLSEKFYLRASLLCGIFAGAAVIVLTAVGKNLFLPFLFAFSFFLGWAYSEPPLRLSYHRLGEAAVFLAFGPLPVLTGYLIQSGTQPENIGRALILGVPFGLFTVSLLLINEIPDRLTDLTARKYNIINSIAEDHAWKAYALVITAGIGIISALTATGLLPPPALLAITGLIPAWRVVSLLNQHQADKQHLLLASRLSLLTATSIQLIVTGSIWLF